MKWIVFLDIFCTKGLFWFRKFDNDTSRLYSNLHNYFNIHICPFLCSLPYCCLSILSCFQFLQFYQKMGLTKFALFVFRVKNVHFWLPSQCTPRVSEVRQSLATTMGLKGKQNIFQIGDSMALGSSFRYN